jgi:hypothetical protein
MRRGSSSLWLAVRDLSSRGALIPLTQPCCYIQLVEPDVQISRIGSRTRPYTLVYAWLRDHAFRLRNRSTRSDAKVGMSRPCVA